MKIFRVAVLCLAVVVAKPALADPPLDPATGLPLPLLEGERLAPLKGGCNIIVDESTPAQTIADISQQRWLGACRFGLVHGTGYRLDADGKPPEYALHARYGKYSMDEEGTGIERYDNGWIFEFHDTAEQARAAGRAGMRGMLKESTFGDLSWNAIQAKATNIRRKDADNLAVWIASTQCPPLNDKKINTAPAFSANGFSAEDTKILASQCDAAYRRLQSEVGLSSNPYDPWGMEPFKTRDYGYYYSLRVERTVGGQHSKQQLACPQPANAGSCAPVWQPIAAPFIALRDAEKKRQAERDAVRKTRIDALEAAFSQKLAARRASAAQGSKR